MKNNKNTLQEKYYKRKQKCKQSDGDSGSYVLSYTDKKGKKHRACHTSKKNMQGQIAAIEAGDEKEGETLSEELVLRGVIREMFLILVEDVRKRGNEWCAYVDDKLTKAEKENNPKKYKGKKVGSIQRTKSGKPRMKARACYRSKKKANNAMAAAMMG